MQRIKTLTKLNIATFLQSQIFLIPVLLLFYQHNGLTIGDFFLFQGIYSLTRILLEVPSGYLGDLFPKKNILVLSYSFFILRCLLWIFFAQYGYWIILFGEVLFGAQKAFFSGAVDSYVYEYLQTQNKQDLMPKQYGKMWAYLSAGATISSLFAAYLYHHISEYTISLCGRDYGFISLLLLELILNVSAVILLLQLPKIIHFEAHKKSLKEIYMNFFHIIRQALQRSDLKYHILFSAILWGTTNLFGWAFQPIMQMLFIPVTIYGFVYFMNYLSRMTFSAKTGAIIKHISLPVWGSITFVGFLICFALVPVIINLQPLPLWTNLLYFLLVSLVIGCQVAFSNINTSRLHFIINPDIRSTVSSFYSMSGQLFSSLYLILLKFLIEKFSMQVSLGICFCIFILGIVPLIKIFKLSK